MKDAKALEGDMVATLSEEGWALLGELGIGAECQVTIDGRRARLVLSGWDTKERQLFFLVPIDQVARGG